MKTISKDVRHAVRLMARQPLFTLGIVVTLALGIGANTAVFTVVDAILLRPLPYPEAGRLVRVWENDRIRETTREWASIPDYFDFKEQSRSFEALGGYTSAVMTFTGPEDTPERMVGYSITHNLFPLLGVGPIVGRGFLEEEDQPDGPAIILLSEGVWDRRFGRDPNLIGDTVEVDGIDVVVVGVMPGDFGFPLPGVDAWFPARAHRETSNMSQHGFRVYGRLKPNVSLEAAQEEMTTIASRLERQYPDINLGRGVEVVSMQEDVTGDVRPALLLFLGAVGLVLLIATANVANLLLSRSAGRTREVAIRRALGARSSQLVGQLLTESVLLSLIGGIAGTALAYGSIHTLVAFDVGNLPRVGQLAVYGRILIFTLLVSLGTGLVFGLAPALEIARHRTSEALKEGGRDAQGSSPGHARVRDVLVVGEITLAVLLVIGAGLLIRSFSGLLQVDPGFDSANIVKFQFQLPASRYPQDFANFPNWDSVIRFQTELLDRVRPLPGVDQLALGYSHPLATGFTTRFSVEGQPAIAPGEQEEVRVRAVSADYFNTLRIPFLRGRGFDDRDHSNAPAVMMVNEAFRRRYVPDEDPIGKHVQIFGRPYQVIGIVGDVKFMGLGSAVAPAVYPHINQFPFGFFSLLIRTLMDVAQLIPSVRAQAREVDPQLAVFQIETMDEILSNAVARPRFNMWLLATFAGVALAMAGIGVYGVMAYSVSRRTHEIGVRMALGASRSNVAGMVLKRGLGLTAAGTVLGLGAAYGLTRLMSSLLYGVETTDTLTFLVVTLILVVVALVASYMPAHRATRVDPMVALRYE
jgi:putative ABC transport system permease protein